MRRPGSGREAGARGRRRRHDYRRPRLHAGRRGGRCRLGGLRQLGGDRPRGGRGAVLAATAAAGTAPERVHAAGLALAGVDWPGDEEALSEALRAAGMPRRHVVVNDAFAALRAGSPDGVGVVSCAGTGSSPPPARRTAACSARSRSATASGAAPGSWPARACTRSPAPATAPARRRRSRSGSRRRSACRTPTRCSAPSPARATTRRRHWRASCWARPARATPSRSRSPPPAARARGSAAAAAARLELEPPVPSSAPAASTGPAARRSTTPSRPASGSAARLRGAAAAGVAGRRRRAAGARPARPGRAVRPPPPARGGRSMTLMRDEIGEQPEAIERTLEATRPAAAALAADVRAPPLRRRRAGGARHLRPRRDLRAVPARGALRPGREPRRAEPLHRLPGSGRPPRARS